ncbi:hypothetical protein [Phenylobacterium sp.]|uniref:hypothetical protein n=1 Tax=Phenylobacterium sp. TaxID=1871053 RepID=UPI0025CC6E4F|nr:hypothetical protein [Phenylobacterium sp.]MCA3719823.1 hypothetical protein [Phenylobacterium sp.]
MSVEVQRIIGVHIPSWAHWLSQPLLVVGLIVTIVSLLFITISKTDHIYIYDLDNEKLSKKSNINKKLLLPNLSMALVVSFCIVLIYIQIATSYSSSLSVTSAAWVQAAGSILAVATMIYANFLGQHFDREKAKKDELYRREKRVLVMLRMRLLVEDSPNNIVNSPGPSLNQNHLDQIKVCLTIIDLELDNKIYLDETYGALKIFRDHLSVTLEHIIHPSMHSHNSDYVDYCIETSSQLINILKIFKIRIEHD